MTDDAALLAAVAAAPDDDLPRLVYADWLDENGQPERAEFVRAQVRLAATDPWEPFAVLCRHRRPEWTRGDRWWDTLPEVDGWAVEWHPDHAFRRGFGWSLMVRDVRYLLEIGPRLFAEAPIGQLHLPNATLDEWRAFARADWLPRVKSLHFYSTTTPIEPIRELIASPLATGIEEIVFEKSSGHGMPVLLDDMLRSPFGQQSRRLELRVGLGDSSELIETICEHDPSQLRELSLTNVSFGPLATDRLMATRFVDQLVGLRIADTASHGGIVRRLTDRPRNLEALIANRAGIPLWHLAELADTENLPRLRVIDLNDNPIASDYTLPSRVAWAESLAGVKVVRLGRCAVYDSSLGVLIRCRFWPNLVELDLRDNRITNAGAAHLLAAPVPADLTALLLDGNPISDGMWTRLCDHFGERLVL
jgi:uncharacterized protein (TIGR02996 family)